MRRTQKHSRRRGGRHTRRHRTRRGGGYGFGGSILSNAGGANAGNQLWVPDTGADCGSGQVRPGNSNLAGGRRRKMRKGGAMPSDASLLGRGGNNPTGGRRTRRLRGGMVPEAVLRAGQLNPALVQQSPRTGYTFDGSGVAGTSDPVRLNG